MVYQVFTKTMSANSLGDLTSGTSKDGTPIKANCCGHAEFADHKFSGSYDCRSRETPRTFSLAADVLNADEVDVSPSVSFLEPMGINSSSNIAGEKSSSSSNSNASIISSFELRW